MFENATTLQFRKGKTQEALAILRESIAPVLMKHSQLLSLGFIPNEPADCITVVSIWSSDFNPLQVEAWALYRSEIARLDHLLAEPALISKLLQPRN